MSFESLSRKGWCRCGLAFPNHSMPFLSAASSYHFVGGCITEEKIANEGTVTASGLCQGNLMWSFIFVPLSSKGLVILAVICRCGVCCILCASRDLKGEMNGKKEGFRSSCLKGKGLTSLALEIPPHPRSPGSWKLFSALRGLKCSSQSNCRGIISSLISYWITN